MEIPSGYSLKKLRSDPTPGETIGKLDDDDWYLLEDVAFETDELGVDEPDNSNEGWILYNNDSGIAAAAVWTGMHHKNENEMYFHIAVIPDERGLNLSSFLLNVMEQDLERRKEINNKIYLKAFVVNPILKSSLNRRGYFVSSDQRKKHEPHAYAMMAAPSANSLLEKAIQNNPKAFMNALRVGAKAAGFESAEWVDKFKNALNDVPSAPFANGVDETLKELPLEPFEIQSLWGRFEQTAGLALNSNIPEPPIPKPKEKEPSVALKSNPEGVTEQSQSLSHAGFKR